MQLNLAPHPNALPSDPELKLWADIAHAHILAASASAKVWFCVGAPIRQFAVAGPAEPGRADELWRTTCFEIFLRRPGEEPYREWNFAPSGQWAAYDFAAYREGRAGTDVRFAPEIVLQDNLTWWQVGVTVPLDRGPWQLGLSAVIEEQGGTQSYWALAHPPGGKPDFHAPDCFAARLA
jgi:hypothetical protein